MPRVQLLLGLVTLLGCECAKKPFTCSDYDDDDKYDAYECSSYDSDACDVQCRNDTLCDRLCGVGNTSCADGGGAVCAMRVLSDIDAVCARLAAVGDDDDARATAAATATPPAVAALGFTRHGIVAASSTSAAASTYELWRHERRGLGARSHPVIANEGQGCDDHVYCEYCEGNPSCVSLVAHASRYVTVASTSFGPIAMALLRGLDAVCANRSHWLDADDDGGVVSSVEGGDSPHAFSGSGGGGLGSGGGFGEGDILSGFSKQLPLAEKGEEWPEAHRMRGRPLGLSAVAAVVAVAALVIITRGRRHVRNDYAPLRT